MFQTNETCTALEGCYLMSNIPKRNLASGCHLLKKIDQTYWRTTRRNLKHLTSNRVHIIQIPSAAPSLMEFEQPEVLWRYTDILICHLKHVEVGWSTLKYPHTDHCHKHVRYHDGVTLYFSMKFPSVTPKKKGNGYFSYMSADFRFLKLKQPKEKTKKRGKPWLNARKHRESKSRNRNLSAEYYR